MRRCIATQFSTEYYRFGSPIVPPSPAHSPRDVTGTNHRRSKHRLRCCTPKERSGSEQSSGGSAANCNRRNESVAGSVGSCHAEWLPSSHIGKRRVFCAQSRRTIRELTGPSGASHLIANTRPFRASAREKAH